MGVLVRSIAVWLVLICAEILHGIARGIFLVPHVGEFRSNQIGVLTGSIIILVIALLFVRWIGASRIKITEAKTLEFFGNLSLENNGGFASVRTKAKKLGLEKGDSLVVKMRGDGREYTLNLYVPRPLVAFSYRATVETKKDEWIEVKLPLDKFEATSFGRPVRDAGPVDPKEVNALGFLLGDKKAGPFRLEVQWIKVERAGK